MMLTNLFASVVLVPVLSIIDVVEIPTCREERTKSRLCHAVYVVTVSTPYLDDRVWLQLNK